MDINIPPMGGGSQHLQARHRQAQGWGYFLWTPTRVCVYAAVARRMTIENFTSNRPLGSVFVYLFCYGILTNSGTPGKFPGHEDRPEL